MGYLCWSQSHSAIRYIPRNESEKLKKTCHFIFEEIIILVMMEDEWQNRFSGVIERNRYAFENSKFSDVEFSVGGTQEAIQAHKYMLAISSPVFEAMFYGPLAETTRIINIPDCTKEGLREMIRYIYTDEASITGNNVIELNYLARKYSILSLERKCDDFMYNHVEPEDVLLVLPHVQKLQKRDLEERCWSIIDKDTKRVFESQAFLDTSRELLCRILSRDTLQIKELELFQAADRWVCKKIKDRGLDEDGDVKRGILGDELVRLIRFPTMKMTDFIEHVLDSEILQKGELTEVLKRFTFLEPSTSVFNTTPRSETPKSRPRLSRRYLSADSDSESSRSQSHSRSRSRSRSHSRSRNRSRSRSRSRSHSRSLSPIVHQIRHRQNRSRNRRTRSRSPNRGLFRRRSIFE